MTADLVPLVPSEASDVVAVIPARGGSRGVPNKNLQTVGGRSLIARAVDAAHAAGIEQVWVSTDDAGIADAARAAGAGVIDRPAELAGDTASSESALLHALDELAAQGVRPRVLAFLQATSPFIDADALRRAIERVRGDAADSVFAAYETYVFLWRAGPAAAGAADARGVNHDHSRRPRRQDRSPDFAETGAFYVLDVAGFQTSQFRFFGRIEAAVVDEARAIEIDDPAQLATARALAVLLDPPVAGIDADALVTDFDGVHTDDTAAVTTDGVESVRVSRSDGLGVGRLRAAGIPMLILSKERNQVVAARAAKLGIPVLHGVDDKAAALTAWIADQGLDPKRVAYVGNDVNDLPALALVGWPVVVPDASAEIRAHARVVLQASGGHGAVREVAELILAGRKEPSS